MVLVDDFREIWNCTSWLKKIVWIQPEIKREHGTTEALTFPFPFPFGRLKFEKRARDVEKEGVILSLTQQRRGVIRCALCITISFPFLSAIINQNKDAKLVPNSHPFSIEYPHQSITLAFFPSIPCFFSWLLNNKLSSRITTLSTNHQKNGRNNKFGFFHLGLLLFLWFLFCFVLFVVQVFLNTEMGFVVLFGIFKCIQRWKSGNKTIKRISRDLLCFHWMMILLFQVLLAPLFPISSF